MKGKPARVPDDDQERLGVATGRILLFKGKGEKGKGYKGTG